MRKWILLLISLIFAVVLILQFWLYFISLPFWHVKEVVIKNNDYIPVNIVSDKVNIQEKQSIFKVNVDEITQKVEKIPNVKRVFVKRDYPDRVLVEMETRQPFLKFFIRQRYWVVDEEGVILNRAQFQPDNITSLNVVTGLTSISQIQGVVKSVQELQSVFNSFLPSEEIVIDIEHKNNLNVVLTENLLVKIGDPIYLSKKIKALKHLLLAFQEQNISRNKLAYIDLRSYQNPVAKFR